MSRFHLLVVAAGLALVAATPAWADLKIGYVNYARLMQESPQAKAAQESLRTEFAPKQRELQALQASLKSQEEGLEKDGATMTADQRTTAEKKLRDGNRDYSQKLSAYQDDANARQNEEMSKLQKTLVEEVQNYAQAQKFDLVLAEGVIFASPGLDITAQILSGLQARSTRPGGSAPAKAPSGTSGK
jgi:outer membrane protein